MDPSLPDAFLLQELESLAARLEIDVRYESLADDELTIHSGGCKVLDRKLIIIDKNQPIAERAYLLARELSRYELEDFYLLPRVREFIQASSREKNLPQR
jgi:hypothetical protein